MSLFDEIRRLHRRDKFEMEDFHTEIAAQVLRDSSALTFDWLRSIGALKLQQPRVVSITTQEKFTPLDEDQPGSRIDLVIRLSENGVRQIVFIESKIDSTENPGQLPKYAGVITKKEGFDHNAIIYVTRDFEVPRPAPVITTRWFQFYKKLQVHVNGDGLAEQLKLFMQEHKMAIRNQFTAIDSLALSNFLPARALMHETLWSGVHKKFEEILGKVSSDGKCMSQLGKFDRYIMYVDIGQGYDFECLLGYWLPKTDPTEAAWLGVSLNSNPKSRIRGDVVSSFREFSQQNAGWEQINLDDDKDWAAISKGKELTKFLAEPDHLRAVQEYFLALLDEVKLFKSQYAKLPWKTRAADRSEEEG